MKPGLYPPQFCSRLKILMVKWVNLCYMGECQELRVLLIFVNMHVLICMYNSTQKLTSTIARWKNLANVIHCTRNVPLSHAHRFFFYDYLNQRHNFQVIPLLFFSITLKSTLACALDLFGEKEVRDPASCMIESWNEEYFWAIRNQIFKKYLGLQDLGWDIKK